jgi:GNAT superfamily N-acetyltransferase
MAPEAFWQTKEVRPVADLVMFSDEEVPAGIKCQVLSFHRLQWWEDYTGENRLRDWIQPPELHPAHVAIVEDGVLISYAAVVWKLLEHAGAVYTTFGLSGVLTYPAFRGQGYGRRVVEAATEVIRASDADIGLFTCEPSLSHFYAASGWIPMERAVLQCGPRSAPLTTTQRAMMGFFSEKGRHGRPSFESLPIYFGHNLW